MKIYMKSRERNLMKLRMILGFCWIWKWMKMVEIY